jgi:iron(III) transport system substrate-binding protein
MEPVKSCTRTSYLLVLTSCLMMSMLLSACGKSANTSAGSSTHSVSSGNTKAMKTLEEIALYEGNDREKRLIEAAKKEGTFNLYTSIPIEDMQKITDGFKQKYGITANIWRANSVNVTQRITTEARSSKPSFDVVAMSSVQNEALSREKLLQKVNSPNLNNIMKEALPSHQEWIPIYYNIFVQAYNNKLIKGEELPKTYQDLLSPRWKGPMGVETSGYDWFSAIVKQMGEEKGAQFFKDLMKHGNVTVRTGYSSLAEMVAAGEVPYALTVFSYKARQMKAQGAPIDWYAIEPAIARSNSVAISKKATHPNSAVLFLDYCLSDGQRILADMFYDPTNQQYQLKDKINISIINEQTFIDEYPKWFNLHEDIVIKRK